VGPNNSGKSLLLREIESYAEGRQNPHTGLGLDFERKILDQFDPQLPGREEAEQLLRSRKVENSDLGPTPPGYLRVYKIDLVYDQYQGRHGYIQKDIPLTDTLGGIETFHSNPQEIRHNPVMLLMILQHFVSLFTIRLDGSTRLALTEPRLGGDIKAHAQNHFWALAQNEQARARLRKITYDAFGRYFVIDPTSMQTFRVSMSDTEPPPHTELYLGPEGREFFSCATDIADLSDGIKAFTGLVAAVLSADFRVMLVDEPEAFLHPVLVRKLGRRLTELASNREGNVLAATHSPDFLMGCVEAGNVNVIRLTYRREVPSARILPANDLRGMMRDPLLRSTGVLSALFHEGAVVCEGDSDRAFYQEINYRLLTAGSEGPEDSNGIEESEEHEEPEGIDNTIFLSAQNKSTIQKIVQPLRAMGIPSAAVVDIDVFKESSTFKTLLKAVFVPQTSVNVWGAHRGELHSMLKAKDTEYQRGGIDLLDPGDRESAETLINNLAEYGIFVVPVGDLEMWLGAWLSALGEKPRKDNWVPRVFELMGSDPTDANYLKPQEGDVWDFMRKVAEWIANPNRKGMPE
jgi:hypothetical protein